VKALDPAMIPKLHLSFFSIYQSSPRSSDGVDEWLPTFHLHLDAVYYSQPFMQIEVGRAFPRAKALGIHIKHATDLLVLSKFPATEILSIRAIWI
jgi:hypothetical protein